ncbi:uncharacterized protein LOC119989356 isoform X4 [Tripterygium wilfordii]|uniref:uncharacterized protein LOC119989356 isoform X4 n=1 Tax=Tripterygium wilfordii TaxID=458696 RepID=UPI0018F85C33|nr:uncharacterized protein LOC119989356 isoform X4 [Tripterygium wilfordii]
MHNLKKRRRSDREMETQVRECIKELVKFTLDSYVNGNLGFDLGLSKEFCVNLLMDDPVDPSPQYSSNTDSADSLKGVPCYPLHRHLTSALYHYIVLGEICSTHKCTMLMNEDVHLKQKKNGWNKLIVVGGSELVNVLKAISCEFDVEEPFFSLFKDGQKTVEGRCAIGDHDRIKPGALILLNKILVLEVQNVYRYASFSEMLEAETLAKVLPGVNTVEEGVKVYRKFCPEEKESLNGVIAIHVSKVASQPYLSLATMFLGLSYGGVRNLLGLVQTAGTISDGLPPPRSSLLSSFMLPFNPKVKGSVLTTGARALMKHAERSSDRYWGGILGNDYDKNRHAMEVISRLMSNCCWINVHIVPPHGVVFEIRVASGYGARWSKDGNKFIGFLEPYMDDGHSKGWKH